MSRQLVTVEGLGDVQHVIGDLPISLELPCVGHADRRVDGLLTQLQQVGASSGLDRLLDLLEAGACLAGGGSLAVLERSEHDSQSPLDLGVQLLELVFLFVSELERGFTQAQV